ncbi:thiamine-phosphate kinase [Lautropia mirabilis]|uniref:thiamine-phosphate kinase n=1 Tax=Lautropia mirabilis TaxID=47671 RepID=UPI0028D6132E|nr:thiamine-phosphate kinase [Lautropia mirabilis]
MNEFALIRQYFERQPAPLPASTGPAAESLVKLGIGDDCALLDPVPPGQQLAISTDMLVAGRHFFEGTDPAAIGHKALAVNLSDLAAMGARPVGFTLALALPTADAAWLQGFADGLFGLAARAACPLIGGDTTRGPLNISITVLGQVPATHALRRDGARVGDAIWVSGPLGAAALAVARRSQGQPVPDAAARRLDWPEPRLAAGLGLTGVASAAMDISDGLAGDLGHLLTASGRRQGLSLGAELWEGRLPLDPVLRESGVAHDEALQLALHGGDDYELLFTAPTAQTDTILQCWPDARMIGRIVAESAMLLVDAKGQSRPLAARGHDHFST